MGGQVIAIFPSKWRAKGRNWWLFFFWDWQVSDWKTIPESKESGVRTFYEQVDTEGTFLEAIGMINLYGLYTFNWIV